MATSAAPRRKTQGPECRLLRQMAISSSKSPRRRRPRKPVSDLKEPNGASSERGRRRRRPGKQQKNKDITCDALRRSTPTMFGVHQGPERDGGGDGASTDVTLEFVILMETDGTSRQRTLFVLWSRFRENSTPRGLTDVLVGDGGLHRHDDSNGANYLATFS